jgi:penicillin-binding protein 2
VPLPSDKPGLIPDADIKKKRHQDNPKAFPFGDWRTGDTVLTAIGQGDVLVTPLQLANAYATFANGGTLFEPRIGAAEPPKPVRTTSIGPSVRQPILEGLKGVIARDEGTGNGKQDTAVFAAFAPANDPQYAIAVVLEEAGFGGSTAAPVARRILEGIGGQPPTPIHLGSATD